MSYVSLLITLMAAININASIHGLKLLIHPAGSIKCTAACAAVSSIVSSNMLIVTGLLLYMTGAIRRRQRT